MELKLIFVVFVLFFLKSLKSSYYKCDGQLLNAYSFFAFEYFIKIFLSSLLVYFFTDEIFNYDNSLKTLYISFLFIGSIWLGFKTKNIPNFFIKKSKFLFMKTRRINRFNNNLKFYGFIFFLLGLVFFLILAIKGGGGSLWLTDSRVAYQFYRKGAGGFYVLSQVLLYVCFICFLINIRSNATKKIILLTFLFLLTFYFFGSKRSLLTIIIISVVYYTYYIRKLPAFKLNLIFLIVASLFISIQFLYSSFDIFSTVEYFTYFDNMVLFFNKNPNFQFMYGKSFFSQLWGLIPRSLYPDKPFVWGTAYITEFIYPGMAEKTHTIGVLPWTYYYLDYGYFGVFFGGIFTGILLKYVQLLFINSKSIFAFIIFINYGFSNILKHVPFFVLFILIFLSITYLRLSIKKK